MLLLLPIHSFRFIIFLLPGAVFSAVRWFDNYHKDFRTCISARLLEERTLEAERFGVFIILMLWLYFSAIVFL